jgi:hypothetical protein
MASEAHRRNDYDVTNRINTTDPQIVSEAVSRIYQDLYQQDTARNLPQAFTDLGRLYRGEYPGFHECDTHYHDIQHVMDVTLGMARLLDGCVRTSAAGTITERQFRLGIVSALFHDCGYIRRRKDTKHANGAEYTTVHVSRGAEFLEEYLPKIGMADLVLAATRIVHFTGYEIPVNRIRVPSVEFRLLGNLLGSADILAQMADRCYLEKCYDRLYPEFVRGGIARKRHKDGSEEIVFASAADLIFKTPRFYQGATRRLREDLGGCYTYVEQHFGGPNLYFDELEKNISPARSIAVEGQIPLLRRRPPRTRAGQGDERPQQQLI